MSKKSTEFFQSVRIFPAVFVRIFEKVLWEHCFCRTTHLLHITAQCYHFQHLVLILGQQSHYFLNNPCRIFFDISSLLLNKPGYFWQRDYFQICLFLWFWIIELSNYHIFFFGKFQSIWAWFLISTGMYSNRRCLITKEKISVIVYKRSSNSSSHQLNRSRWLLIFFFFFFEILCTKYIVALNRQK